MSSFSLSGGVEVFGFISPSDTTDQYPVIDPLYGIDGLRNVDFLSDLDNIPTLRRRAGMVVGVSGGTTYYKLNPGPWNNTITDWSVFSSGGGVSGDYLPLSGGTVSGGTQFTNGLTANTISATTYFNLPSDIYVTGYTYSDNTFTIERSSGQPNLSTTINDVTGLTINGNLNVTGVTYTNTLSATTYQNLPTDVFVTGGTFSGGDIIFTNNTGGTFNVSGISSFDTFVTGFTYNDNTFSIFQNSGSSLNATIDIVTGLTINGNLSVTGTTSSGVISATTYQNLPIDVFVTGGTYSNGTASFTNNTGGTFNVVGFFTGNTDVFVTGATYNNNSFTYTNNTGGTFNVSFDTMTGLTINGNLTTTGNTIVNGTISGNTLISTQSSGDEGGQLDLYIPQTNTSLSGISVSIDVYQNRFRIFESGSPNRGVYIDLTTASSGVGTNLLATTGTFDYGKSYVIANNQQWF